MKDIIITIPKTIKWSEYQKELDEAENGAVMNFKVNHFPKESGVGADCWIIYDGMLIGSMKISGFVEHAFTCSTTGKEWEGKFIQRTGKLEKVLGRVPMKGFQGWRYFEAI